MANFINKHVIEKFAIILLGCSPLSMKTSTFKKKGPSIKYFCTEGEGVKKNWLILYTNSAAGNVDMGRGF